MTWSDYNDKVKKLAAGLAGLGLQRRRLHKPSKAPRRKH